MVSLKKGPQSILLNFWIFHQMDKTWYPTMFFLIFIFSTVFDLLSISLKAICIYFSANCQFISLPISTRSLILLVVFQEFFIN